MVRGRPSIWDIAEAANVSSSTVSRALRNSPLISLEVRERVQRLACEMGYTPNAIAQSLQTRRTHTIGLVVTSIADPFFADIMKGVEEIARPAGLSVFLSSSYTDPEQEMAAIQAFHRRRVDGILVADSLISRQYRQQLANTGVPTVLINSQAEEQSGVLHSVTVDDTAGARLAVEHLLTLGHRSIAYIGAGNRPMSNQRRLQSYRDTLAAAGVQPCRRWEVIAPGEDELHEDDVAAGRALLVPLLEAGVTAVCCYNDMISVGALMACREHGIRVPEELSIVGFDDIPVAQYITPRLTTVHQPIRDLGRCAMQMLLDLLREQTVQNRVLAPSLVVRDSSAALQRDSSS